METGKGVSEGRRFNCAEFEPLAQNNMQASEHLPQYSDMISMFDENGWVFEGGVRSWMNLVRRACAVFPLHVTKADLELTKFTAFGNAELAAWLEGEIDN